MGRDWWGEVPCVGDDNVVEGGVFLAEAGKAYSDDHCGCAGFV